MIPQLGFTEFLLIAIVALVVVGPRDLPGMMRKVGGWVARARGMAREFQGAFDDMGREVELEELRKEIEAIKNANPLTDIADDLKQTEDEVRDDVAS
ncbi:MAG: Sec-independent protein translocase protein TatB [Robiginitomaculum sp.]|nr:Sec-independent protein translocase protein TatB [Robiginitomaculum sp.]MDQ7077595.1 Sec-independent protein translocase protein TatB [Robiginitomaculum sp.]